MRLSKVIFALFIVQTICFIGAQAVFCQTETLGIFQYTAPSGWTKTTKDGAVVFTNINKATSAFGVMTVYASTDSSGDAKRDFAAKWKDLVVTPLKGEANPDANTQTAPDGWKSTSAGSLIEFNGIKAYAILSVTSGFGKSAGILTIFTDQSFLVDMQAFIDAVKMVKAKADPGKPAITTAATGFAPIEHWSILREYQDNQLAADAKYGGKRVAIVGEMDFVLIENGKPVVRMSVPAWSGRQMFCEFPLAQKTAVAQLKANQKVVMECTVLGIAGGVSKVGRVDLGSSVGRLTLNNCVLK